MLANHKVGSLPDVAYIPEYITADEEGSLLEHIVTTKAKWTQVSGRRLLSYGGHIHEKKGVLLQAPMPSWLKPLLERLARDTGAFGAEHEQPKQPNHVLLNAYLPGQGILAHQDGPLYFAGVCIVSLGAPAVMRFTRKRSDDTDGPSKPVLSVALMPRSLLVFNGEAYEDCLHGIDEVGADVMDDSLINRSALPASVNGTLPRDRERYSLTVRRVLRTKNLLGKCK